MISTRRKRRCKTDQEGGGEEMRRQFNNGSREGGLPQDHAEDEQADRDGDGHGHPHGHLPGWGRHHQEEDDIESSSGVYKRGKF